MKKNFTVCLDLESVERFKNLIGDRNFSSELQNMIDSYLLIRKDQKIDRHLLEKEIFENKEIIGKASAILIIRERELAELDKVLKEQEVKDLEKERILNARRCIFTQKPVEEGKGLLTPDGWVSNDAYLFCATASQRDAWKSGEKCKDENGNWIIK